MIMYNAQLVFFSSVSLSLWESEAGCIYYDTGYDVYNENIFVIDSLSSDFYHIRFEKDCIWLSAEDGPARKLSTVSWDVIDERSHRIDPEGTWLNELFYSINISDDVVEAYNANSILRYEFPLPKSTPQIYTENGLLYVGSSSTRIICLKPDLSIEWEASVLGRISFTSQLMKPSDHTLLVNMGESYFENRYTYTLSALDYANGECAWQHVFAKEIEYFETFDGKVYVCAGTRFVSINAKTGDIECDYTFDYLEPANGELRIGEDKELIVVRPVNGALLCVVKNNPYIELRSLDCETVLQTIYLPDRCTGSNSVVITDDAIYLKVVYMGIGPSDKHMVLVLKPDPQAPEKLVAVPETRPPYTETMHAHEDQKGEVRNAYHIAMQGDDAALIKRYAHIVLKELAFTKGYYQMHTFDTTDPLCDETLVLEISTAQLSEKKPLSEWQDYFGIVAERLEDELLYADLTVADEKPFKIEVRVV